MKNNMMKMASRGRELWDDASFWMMRKYMQAKDYLTREDPGVDGILVTVGLCVIALVLCVVMKSSLEEFIKQIVTEMQNKASTVLSGTTTSGAILWR